VGTCHDLAKVLAEAAINGCCRLSWFLRGFKDMEPEATLLYLFVDEEVYFMNIECLATYK
jgi:hypothetical protein